jgi:hypothetical protein
VKNWVLKTEVNGSTSDDKIASLPLMTRSLILGQKTQYVRFLADATARIFLRKVGGGYIFVHRMLLEYFVARHQLSVEQQNCNRNG